MYPSDLPDPIAGFVPTKELGRGAFGSVYRARHHALDIDVAVKVIDVHKLAGDPDKVLREARLMARLDHPNLLRILDAGRSSDSVYLVLELMDGGSCKGLRELPATDALDVARQLLSGVQALHDARILHRDIKPANCLRRARDGRVKLADLGIAAEWQTGAGYDRSGTLPYMAPELFDDDPKVGPGTDLYALGMTLACMLLPEDPFPPGPMGAVIEWTKNGPRPRLTEVRPDLPVTLTALVDRMIARNIDDRPASAAEALAALAGVDTPLPATPAKPVSPSVAGIASTAPFQETVRAADRVGVWVLGEQIYESSNWLGHVAYHAQTGQATRIMRLQPGGPLSTSSTAILAATDRASRLAHPGVIEIVDWGLHHDRAFIVTAPQGRTIHSLVDGARPLDEPTVIAFAASLADALAYLHARDLVYQLLDPGSAAVGGDARTAMLSWPIYCTSAGTTARSADGKSQRFLVRRYAAPEVLSGTSTTIESSVDLYGLGATLVHALVGPVAYDRARGAGDLANVRAHAPTITARFARLINDLMALEPKDRPTAAATRAELGTIARQLGIPLAT